jgi:hypothetical protein
MIRYILIACLLLTACKKEAYLTDGGVSSTRTDLSTYDYLANHQFKMFDTVIAIIDHYNLKEDVNNAKTFFAPTDYTVANYIRMKLDSVQKINENNTYSLDDMYNDITIDSIKQYLFSEMITVSAAQETAVNYTTMGNTPAAVLKVKQTDPIYYTWSKTPVYLLYYTKVVGTPDIGTIDPNDPEADRRAQCQTTGILTASGGVLHVLINQHIFVRF